MEKSLQENKNIIQVIEDPYFRKGSKKKAMSRVGNEGILKHMLNWKNSTNVLRD